MTVGTPDTADVSPPIKCPVCGAAVDGIGADRRASPCGHSIADLTLSTLQTHE